MKNNLILSLVIVVLFSITYVSALTNSINLNIQCENSGVVCTGSYSYKFDLSTNTDCSSPDYTTTKSITTDARGIFSTTLTNVNLDFVNNNYRLCVYRDLVLKSNLTISTVPYSYYAQNTSWVGVSGRPTALSQFTNDIGVNASFNQSLTDTIYYPLNSNPSNFLNLTTGQGLNDTNLIYSSYQGNFNSNLTGALPLQNRTISHISNITGFFYNYNATTASFTMSLLNNTIAQYGVLVGFNDTKNPFNQVVNITSNLTIDYINATGNITSSKWFNGLFNWTTTSHFTFNGALLSLTSSVTQWFYNQTTPAITDINNRFWNITQSWNRTQLYNKTEIDNFNASWISTFNATYNSHVNKACTPNDFVRGFNSSGGLVCEQNDPAIDIWAYNQTTPAIDDINSRFWNRTQSYNKTQIDSFNASWTATYNQTYEDERKHTHLNTNEGNITRAFNTLYQNGRNRTIMVYGSVNITLSNVNSADIAYATIKVGSSNPPTVVRQQIGNTFNLYDSVSVSIYRFNFPFTFVVEPNNYYTINRTQTGIGEVTLDSWSEVDI